MNAQNTGIRLGHNWQINRLIAPTVTALVATTGISAIAQAGTIRHDRYDWQYRSVAASRSFDSVGRIDINDNSLCSGTLVAPMWVLTAAHCIDGMRVASFSVGNTTTSISRAIYGNATGWFGSNGDPFSGYDIGLLHLRDPIQGINPARLFTGFNELGKIGTYIGYGASGTGLTGEIWPAGLKRGGHNIINATGRRYGWSNSVLLSDFDNPNRRQPSDNRIGLSTALNLEYSIAHGDSGGGMFINGRLAGVNSFGIDPVTGSTNPGYGVVMGTTRVSPFARWINSVISGQRAFRAVSRPGFNAANNSNYSESSLDSLVSDLYESASNQPDRVELLGDDAVFDEPDNDIVFDDSEPVPEPSTIVGLFSVIGLSISLRRRQRSLQPRSF